MAGLAKAGRRGKVIGGAEGDDEEVALVARRIGGRGPRHRVDGQDRLLAEADRWLREPGIGVEDLRRGSSAEDVFELGIAEDEFGALVDQGDCRRRRRARPTGWRKAPARRSRRRVRGSSSLPLGTVVAAPGLFRGATNAGTGVFRGMVEMDGSEKPPLLQAGGGRATKGREVPGDVPASLEVS